MEIQQGIGQNEGGVTTVSVSGQALLTGNVTFSAGSNITLTQVGQNIAIASTGSGSGSVTSVASADGSITVTNPTTTPDLAVVKSPKLTTARTIGGVSFDGTANITVASATGGFTISGGDLVLGVNNITMTGSLGATGARLTKGWFTDLQVTNAIAGSITGNATTVTTNANLTGPITSSGNATSIASQTGTGTKFVVDTSPTLVTPVLGVATATSINKVAITAPATSATLTIADGKTLTTSNSITLAGTDGKGINIGAATSLKILTGDGSNMVLSAYTVAAPGTSGNVLTSDGTNWTSAAASGGGSIHLDTISLSSSDILGLFVTPKELVANPGVGMAIVVLNVYTSFTYGGTQYANGGTINFRYGTNTADSESGLTTQIKAAASATNLFAFSNFIGTQAVGNVNFNMNNATGAFTTGNGTLKVFVEYFIATL